MTVEIICGDISALPSSDHAAELLPLTDGDTRPSPAQTAT